jgi:hypothetical protein
MYLVSDDNCVFSYFSLLLWRAIKTSFCQWKIRHSQPWLHLGKHLPLQKGKFKTPLLYFFMLLFGYTTWSYILWPWEKIHKSSKYIWHNCWTIMPIDTYFLLNDILLSHCYHFFGFFSGTANILKLKM